MKIRKFQNDDISEIIKLWNESICDYPITLMSLHQVLFSDDNYDENAFMIAEEENKLIGFCIGIKRKFAYLEKGKQEGQGWILSMAVDHKYRQRKIGSELLKAVEAYLDCQKITLATYSPYYFFGGVDEKNSPAIKFFEYHNYHAKEKAYPMEIDLTKYHTPQAILNKIKQKNDEGYKFHTFTWEDGKPLLDFLRDHFSVGWRMHVIQAIRKETACKTITICTYQGNIVGYVQCGVDNDIERYGPFGVHPQMRNLGIGSILVHNMWQLMVNNGAKKAWFHSTDEAGKRFYERHGMKVVRTLLHYEKGEYI